MARSHGSARDIVLDGPYSRLLSEVLGSIATPQVGETMVAAALREAGYDEVPVDGQHFAAFALGPLRFTVAASLGDDAAELVLEGLRPALGVYAAVTLDVPAESIPPWPADSGVRRRARESLPSPHQGASTVILATPVAHHALVDQLRDRVKTVVTKDIFGLLQALTTHADSSPLVLIDDALPGLRGATFRTMARLLGPEGRVVLFGEGGPRPDEQVELEWFHVGVLSTRDLGDLTLGLLSTAETQPPPAIPRVLLIEPDSTIGRQHYETLTRGGYEVEWVGDSFEGLERCFSDDAPHAVVSNLRLADLGGGQLATLLMTRFREKAPVVMLLADGPLPEPPEGCAAVIARRGSEENVLAELDSWFRA
jgi:CheY-like chemotaxis protein